MQKKIKVTRKQYERIVLAYRIGGFLAIVGLLIGYSFLIGKPIEFALIFLPYFITKGFYERQYHAKSLKQCLLLSIGIFALAITITLPKSYSVCFSLAFGLTIALVSCKVGNAQYIAHEYAALTAPKPFSAETCTESELIAHCKAHNYNDLKTEIAIKFFIHKENPKQVWEWLCNDKHNYMEYDSVYQMKWRMKKELFCNGGGYPLS